jgi:hypothetical protein
MNIVFKNSLIARNTLTYAGVIKSLNTLMIPSPRIHLLVYLRDACSGTRKELVTLLPTVQEAFPKIVKSEALGALRRPPSAAQYDVRKRHNG